MLSEDSEHMTVFTNGQSVINVIVSSNIIKTGYIAHKLADPYPPTTNGLAKWFVQTIKKPLQAMDGERGDVYL